MNLATPRMLRVGLCVLVLGVFYRELFVRPDSAQSAVAGDSLNPARLGELVSRTRSLLGTGRYQEALVPSLELSESFPRNHIYLEQTASIYHQLHHYKEESELWERYLQYAPVPVEGCPQIGLAYQKQGRREEAIGAFERCLRLEPQNPDLIYHLAHALEMSRVFDRAATLYRSGMAAAPANLDMQTGLGRVLLQQGRSGSARQAAARVLRGSPGNSDALLIMGLACLREGDHASAKKYLREGIKVANTNSDFHAALGLLAEAERDPRQALICYNRAVELAPEDRDLARRRDAMARARP